MTKRIFSLLATLFSLMLLSPLAASVYSSSSFPGVPQGYAYGDYASIAVGQNTVTSGPTAPVELGCSTTPGTLTNSASISLGSLVSVGSARSTITVNRTATSASVQVTSDTQNLNLLGGLITSTRIQASALSTASSTGATSTVSSTFTGLNVAGTPTDPAPNTRENLPGVGYVILNEQYGPINGSEATSASVNAMDIHITLGLSAGSRIVIGHASSGEKRTAQPFVVSAYAYGLYASGLASSGSTSLGPVSPAEIGCTGGSSQNSVSAFNAPLVGSSGSMSSSASGQITSSDVNATSQASVSNLNLLGALISAGNVTVTANADWNSTGSRSGSMKLTNGKTNGTPLGSSPLPNSRVNLPGLGYVVINEQYGGSSSSGASETVIAFDIYITQSNLLGLPKGARIVIGLATARTASY
jgi:hypothetical protein